MSPPSRDNDLSYEVVVVASCTNAGSSDVQIQTSRMVWVDCRPGRAGHASPAEEGPPGRDENVKPDLLLAPPEPKPAPPHDPPDSADR